MAPLLITHTAAAVLAGFLGEAADTIAIIVIVVPVSVRNQIEPTIANRIEVMIDSGTPITANRPVFFIAVQNSGLPRSRS